MNFSFFISLNEGLMNTFEQDSFKTLKMCCKSIIGLKFNFFQLLFIHSSAICLHEKYLKHRCILWSLNHKGCHITGC
jgi:hypothetical protein